MALKIKKKNRYKKLYQTAIRWRMPMKEVYAMKKSLNELDFSIRIRKNMNRFCLIKQYVSDSDITPRLKYKTEHVYKSPKGAEHLLGTTHTVTADASLVSYKK